MYSVPKLMEKFYPDYDVKKLASRMSSFEELKDPSVGTGWTTHEERRQSSQYRALA